MNQISFATDIADLIRKSKRVSSKYIIQCTSRTNFKAKSIG